MNSDKLQVRLTLLTEELGSWPANPEIFKGFIAENAPTEEQRKAEIEMVKKTAAALSLEERVEKMSTIFPRCERDGKLVLCAKTYQIKGFLKEAIGVLVDLGEVTTVTKWSYKRAIDSFVFVQLEDENIPFMRDGRVITENNGWCERSLRVDTMQGSRVCLARSEVINVGATLEFGVEVLKSTNPKAKVLTVDDIKKALDYGFYKALGQWRSSGKGRVKWELLA